MNHQLIRVLYRVEEEVVEVVDAGDELNPLSISRSINSVTYLVSWGYYDALLDAVLGLS